MEKISVNKEKAQEILLQKALTAQESKKKILSKKHCRQLSYDFNTIGLKQFLPKNLLFTPMSKASDQKFSTKKLENRHTLKFLEIDVKEKIKLFTVKKIEVQNI